MIPEAKALNKDFFNAVPAQYGAYPGQAKWVSLIYVA
jgi:hypothetical protein